MTSARPRQQKPAEPGKLSRRQFWQLKESQSIKDKNADGQPLTGADLSLLMGLLRQDPRAARDPFARTIATSTSGGNYGTSSVPEMTRYRASSCPAGPHEVTNQTNRRTPP
jgi:hypothetical protein